jgi:hypothetical protein
LVEHIPVKWLDAVRRACVTRFYRLCRRFLPRTMARREMAAAKRRHEALLAENPRIAEWERNAERFRPHQQAFRRAVPEIIRRFEAEADTLIDPAIVFDADEGGIAVVEWIELIAHFGTTVRPRGEDPAEAVALVIQGGDLIRFERVCDPRTHPDAYPWGERPRMMG